MNESNLPPGVTDRMIEEQTDGAAPSVGAVGNCEIWGPVPDPDDQPREFDEAHSRAAAERLAQTVVDQPVTVAEAICRRIWELAAAAGLQSVDVEVMLGGITPAEVEQVVEVAARRGLLFGAKP